MTTAAFEMREAIATDVLSIDDLDILKKVSKYIAKLKAKLASKEEEYISKEEILAGIDAGLKEMKMGLGRPAEELLMEL